MADIHNSPPTVRTSSPSPSASPTPALYACPPLERSVSIASSTSDISSSRSVTDSSRRRGYVRPQPTIFADSARSRESVMSLGSIAHLQHYFARTGLLDGKGAQLLTGKRKTLRAASDGNSSDCSLLSPISQDSTYSSMRSSPEVVPLDQGLYVADGLIDSPVAEFMGDCTMLPPTVSTYQHREKYVAPPPDLDELRRELKECLVEARKVLDETEADRESSSPSSGWYELQGMHVLDVMTLAIRAAKMYYTAHEQPERLAAIKSERKIRGELLGVLEILRKMATRKFAGGMRNEERQTMRDWTEDIEDMLRQEIDLERKEIEEQEGWRWMHGDWSGREREREHAFLQSFDTSPIPEWIAIDGEEPTEFLKEMQNGLRLVLLHNELVRKSKRPFGFISEHHTDTMKPYRCADNLRYWIKEAELRWEIKLEVDVMGVVYGQSAEVWRAFDAQILRWCSVIREEITDHIQSKPTPSCSSSSTSS